MQQSVLFAKNVHKVQIAKKGNKGVWKSEQGAYLRLITLFSNVLIMHHMPFILVYSKCVALKMLVKCYAK